MRHFTIRTLASIALLAAAFVPAFAEESILVLLETSMGEITIELYPEQAPVTVENFLSYVDKGFYDSTLFHRVIPNFMVQAGGFSLDGRRKPSEAPIKNESPNGLRNERGAIAMARTRLPHSARSEFFINTVDNPFLDRENMPVRESSDRPGQIMQPFGYAVFGRVTEGMPIIDRIQSVRTGTRGPMKNWPIEPIMLNKVRRLDSAASASSGENQAKDR